MVSDQEGDDERVGRVLGVFLVVGAFALAISLSITLSGVFGRFVPVGDPGTVSRLLVNVLGLQVVGFGIASVFFLSLLDVEWRSYVRLGSLSWQVVYYGVFLGFVMMLVTVGATLLFMLVDIEPAQAQVGAATDLSFYLVLFLVSTLVVVPMEELFFRGIIQRHLEDALTPALAIATASLLFSFVHTGATTGSGGELITLGLFIAFGVVLGLGYYVTENLLVPIVGHAMFNGIQILVRAVEVAL